MEQTTVDVLQVARDLYARTKALDDAERHREARYHARDFDAGADLAQGGRSLGDYRSQYRGGTTLRKAGAMPGADDAPITAVFSKATQDELPSAPGEQFQIIAAVYSSDNWIAGQWISGWIDAVPTDGDARSETGAIIEQLVPLTARTTYYEKERLAYDGQSRAYAWENIVFSLPGALTASLSAGPVSQNLVDAFWTKSVRLAPSATVEGGSGRWTAHDPVSGIDYALDLQDIEDDQGKVVGQEIEVRNSTHPAPIRDP